MHTEYTPALTPEWDLQLGADGSLKMLTGTEAISQNIANECRCFRGGLFYYQDHGVPWLNDVLAQKFQRVLLVSRLREAVLYAISADQLKEISLESFDSSTRTVRGQIKFVTKEGENVVAQI